MKQSSKLKLGIFIFIVGCLGILALLTTDIPLPEEIQESIAKRFTPLQFKWLSLINPTILLILCTIIGVRTYDKINLTLPVFEKYAWGLKNKIAYVTIVLFSFFTQIIFAQNNPKIDKVFHLNIETTLISKGNNFPDFSIKKDSMDRLLIALHQGFSMKDFQNYTRFNDKKISEISALLASKNYLHQVNHTYKPTIFIADARDGKLLYKYARPISKDIVKSIIKHLPQIITQFQKTRIAQTHRFQHWAFLILSNVLLDSWQINNVEKYFLKQENRPLRNGKHYYYSLMENTNTATESFGIFGNQFQQTDTRKYICIYGNNRNKLKKHTSAQNIITSSDNKVFTETAKSYSETLLKILEKHRSYSKKIYAQSGYEKEITFEEFFIWWYHFIYTQSTYKMHQKGILTIPESGNFDYELRE